ncbi:MULTISPECIES: ABC transporter substrate-binding protein [unclassified Bradyrhizobium]|uniref:ABC transporter substrate-binding protein n=1 Tax=unclassified Bradyrhizobium TaxID=2631580 RepID=UPI001FF795B0
MMTRRSLAFGLLATATFARAASGKVWRVAVVHPSELPENLTENGRRSISSFFRQLKRLGYVENQNIIVERYSAFGRIEAYNDLARKVVETRPDVIVSMHDALSNAFKLLTRSIPVASISADPIKLGIVSSLSRPEGNITGVSADAGYEVFGKRLQFLTETVGKLSNTRFVAAPAQRTAPHWKFAEQAAKEANVPISIAPIENYTPAEYERMFAQVEAEKVDGLFFPTNPEHITNRKLIVELAANHRIPAIYNYRDFVEAGGLMAYGVDLTESTRRLAEIVDELLKGKKPGDIPISQPTKFELLLNRQAADKLNLNFPATLLSIADETI